jgi:putative ABC transport system permease protein
MSLDRKRHIHTDHMLRNYIKIAWRNVVKHKLSSVINMGGLALGMTVAILIGLWLYDELSFNTCHENYARIAQVMANMKFNGEAYTIDTHPMPLASELRNDFSDDFTQVVMSVQESHVLSLGEGRFAETGNYMESGAPDMLTLKMLSGSREGLRDTYSILLSASLSRKLFGNTDPLNRVIKIDNQQSVMVTGVYEDIPDNSDFSNLAFIAPFDLYLASFDWARNKYTNWTNNSVRIYLQLSPHADLQKVSARLSHILASHSPKDEPGYTSVLFLHPMNRWHLYSSFKNGVRVTSDQLQMIWLYTTIGFCVLLLACINFMNLSTARSGKRAKEVGIRKAIGSPRSRLIKQFFSESLVIAFLSFGIALLLVQCSLPWFNGIAGKAIQMPWTSPLFWLSGMIFTLLTGLLAGSYPALYLSSFSPVRVLKGPVRMGRLAAIPRKVLVVVQFTVSIILIIGTMIVYRQIRFAKDRPVGYAQERLLQVQLNSEDFKTQYQIFAEQLKNAGIAVSVAASASPVTSIWSTNSGFSWEGRQDAKAITFSTIAITPSYGQTIGWQFKSGRDFSPALTSDSSGLVINESAAKLMGLSHPTGETIAWDQIAGQSFTILGVVRDMVMESPFQQASPTIFFIHRRDGMNCLLIKLNPAIGASTALSKMETIYRKLVPGAPFDYAFVNDAFNNKFASEERIDNLAGVFAGLAILISCLGLFGLAAFIAEQRTKEISIRKVLGATTFRLWGLLSKDFVLLVFLSCIIASPVAYYLLHQWLGKFEYRIGMSWWIFVAAGLGALLISLLTVSYQAIYVALTNPVKSLKSE